MGRAISNFMIGLVALGLTAVLAGLILPPQLKAWMPSSLAILASLFLAYWLERFFKWLKREAADSSDSKRAGGNDGTREQGASTKDHRI